MITTEDILNLNFYKKERFTGSYRGMRYLIQKERAEDESDCLKVYAWAGPYIFDLTPDEQKTSAAFPFSDVGKQQAVDWLNNLYESRKKEWPCAITITE